MASYSCREAISFGVAEIQNNPDNNIIVGEPLASGKVTVIFYFTCRCHLDEWVLPPLVPYASFLGQTSTEMATDVEITQDKLFRREEALEILNSVLLHWPLCTAFRRALIDFALTEAQKAVESVTHPCGSIEIRYPVITTHMHVYDESLETELATLQSMEEADEGMVPATELSIESLKTVVMAEVSEEGCIICMEEMKGRCDAVALPCLHVFHGECIKRWLRTSHYCPVCRFQMPTKTV